MRPYPSSFFTLTVQHVLYPYTQTQTVSSVVIDGLRATFDVSDNVQTDAGDNYTLTITGNGNFTGTVTSGFTIAKATPTITAQATADSPIQVTVTASVNPNTLTGIQYAVSNTATAPEDGWQSSNVFTGLTAETPYYFFARFPGNNNYNSVTSSAAPVTTPEKAVSRIEIATQPTKLNYVSGEALDLSGLTVTVYYDDNTNETVGYDNSLLSISPAQGTTLGRSQHDGQGVTVTCGGQTATTSALSVGLGAQSALTITGVPGTVCSGDEFTLDTTGGSGSGTVTWEVVSGNATIDATGRVTVTGTGEIEIRAAKAADSDYNAASITVTFTAMNRPSSGGSSTYTITAPDAEHGTVTVSPSRASRGDTVTLTVRPDEGYELDALTVTDANGGEVDLTRESATEYTFEMPRGRVTVEASFVESAPDPLPFADVDDGDWFADAVRYVYENGMMNGTGDTTFSPNMTTSRGMIVTVLWRQAGSPVVNYAMDFDDVNPAGWYGEAIRWAASEGIVGGYGNGQFGPDDPITREQLSVILYRYAAYAGYDVTERADLSGFSDAADASSYALDALAWANAAGIVNGTSGTTLDPQGSAVRAQAAAMLQRFCENIAQ